MSTPTKERFDLFRYRNVIFDMDGTLMDSIPAWAKAFGHTLAQYGRDPDAGEAHFKAHMHRNLAHILQLALAQNDSPIDEHQFDQFEQAMAKRFEQLPVEFFPGALQLLEDLSGSPPGQGCSVFLSSKSRCTTVQARVGKPEIRRYFKVALGNTKHKKGPDHLRQFALRTGQSLNDFLANAVMIGDSRSDIQMALDAGIPGVGISGTISEADLYEAGAVAVFPSVACLGR